MKVGNTDDKDDKLSKVVEYTVNAPLIIDHGLFGSPDKTNGDNAPYSQKIAIFNNKHPLDIYRDKYIVSNVFRVDCKYFEITD